MTLVSLTGDVIRHTRTVWIRQTGDGKKVSCGMSIDYFSGSAKQSVIIKIENTETCFCNMLHVTVKCNMQLKTGLVGHARSAKSNFILPTCAV